MLSTEQEILKGLVKELSLHRSAMRQMTAVLWDTVLNEDKSVRESLERVENLLSKCDDAARDHVVDRAVASAGGDS